MNFYRGTAFVYVVAVVAVVVLVYDDARDFGSDRTGMTQLSPGITRPVKTSFKIPAIFKVDKLSLV